MTARSGAAALLISLLLSIALVVAACGDGGGSETADADYLVELFALDGEFEQQGDILASQVAERIATAGTEEERTEAIRDFSREARELLEQLLDDTKDLDPTEDFEEAQDRRIEALEAADSAWKDLDDQLDDVDSETEMRRLLEEHLGGQLFAAITKACFAERALGIDIGCQAIDLGTAVPTEPTDATPAP